jgi:hypothetical protein
MVGIAPFRIDNEPWCDPDREALTVRLPASADERSLGGRPAWIGGSQLARTAAHYPRVHLRIAPVRLAFDAGGS